jgi:hypothetical protein
MKFTVTIPPLRAPQTPQFRISNQVPKVRIPFLSLLVEPRSLNKWLFMWAFCLYLVFCWACYFKWEAPRLNHDSYVRFGADSPTYWEAVNYRKEHTNTRNVLVSFTGNLLGPVLIGTALRTGIGVGFFNIFLFFVAVEIGCTIPGVNRYRLLFLLAMCSETVPALVTLNKEILVLVTALLMAKYIYSNGHSKLLLGVVLFFSLFARWEQIAIILLFVFLQRKRSVFARNPKIALGFVLGILTVIYPLIARLPGSGIGAFTQYARGANTIAKLNFIQTNFGFPLVVIPKIIMDIFGELLRPMTFVGEYAILGTGDIHSIFIIPLFSIALITLLVMAYRRGLLNPRRPMALLMIIYMTMTAVAPFVQPRYNFFVYVLLAIELSKYTPEPKNESVEGMAPLPAMA